VAKNGGRGPLKNTFQGPPLALSMILNVVCSTAHDRFFPFSGFIVGRKGLLNGVPHRKLARGVIVLLSEDLEVVVDFLGKYTGQIHVRSMELSGDDWEGL